MSTAGKNELEQLKEAVRQAKPRTINDVHAVVESFFNNITWSLLKDEWQKMSTEERELLEMKLLDEYEA